MLVLNGKALIKNLKALKWAILLLFIVPAIVGAEELPKKAKKLEEMSAAEFKEALKKSHAEISSRLGDSGALTETGTPAEKISSLSEKRAYETSAQSRIDMLSHKIRSLDNHYYDNWGYAQKDAAKLRDIQSKARDHLNKIRADNTDSWKVNKQALENLLRQTSDY